LNATSPSLLPSLPRWGEREKSNPSISPFRKERNKRDYFRAAIMLDTYIFTYIIFTNKLNNY